MTMIVAVLPMCFLLLCCSPTFVLGIQCLSLNDFAQSTRPPKRFGLTVLDRASFESAT